MVVPVASIAVAAALAHPLGVAAAGCSSGTPPEVQLCGTSRISWYTNPNNSGSFDTSGPGFKYLFSQTLTSINYEYQVTPTVYTDSQTNGRNVPAQNSSHAIGEGNYQAFQATVTGRLHVPSAGVLDFQLTGDDGFYIGFGTDANGDQATYNSGDTSNLPSNTYNRGYPVQTGDNEQGNPFTDFFSINFPAAGDYNFEIDSANFDAGFGAGGDGLELIFADGSGNVIDNI